MPDNNARRQELLVLYGHVNRLDEDIRNKLYDINVLRNDLRQNHARIREVWHALDIDQTSELASVKPGKDT